MPRNTLEFEERLITIEYYIDRASLVRDELGEGELANRLSVYQDGLHEIMERYIELRNFYSDPESLEFSCNCRGEAGENLRMRFLEIAREEEVRELKTEEKLRREGGYTEEEISEIVFNEEINYFKKIDRIADSMELLDRSDFRGYG